MTNSRSAQNDTQSEQYNNTGDTTQVPHQVSRRQIEAENGVHRQPGSYATIESAHKCGVDRALGLSFEQLADEQRDPQDEEDDGQQQRRRADRATTAGIAK